jgi:hypothetical protein
MSRTVLHLWFKENPGYIAVARDFYDRPIALKPYKGDPFIQFRCCGDPLWDWVNNSGIDYLDPLNLPQGFPAEGNPENSLAKRPHHD